MNRPPDYSEFSMLELFRVEVENHAATLSAGLLELERNPAATGSLAALMRAAHSLKGAAALVQFTLVSRLAHAMEDMFVAAQRGEKVLSPGDVDVLLRGIDFFNHIASTSEAALNGWEQEHAARVEAYLSDLKGLSPEEETKLPELPLQSSENGASTAVAATPEPTEVALETVRVTSATVNRLLGLAGESLVEAHRLQPLAGAMQRLKRFQSEASRTLDGLQDMLQDADLPDHTLAQLNELAIRVSFCQEFLGERIDELDMLDRRSTRLSNRLYQETLQVRMRPFGDTANRFQRLVRDLARSLQKEVRLEILGQNTQVDRDILEKLDAPLTHLLRNALDHGCETPEVRLRQGKLRECVVRLEARHRAGALLVTVADDGAGVDVEKIRDAVVRKNLTPPEVAAELRDGELMEFLFLPGFSTRGNVSEISGRGVGLDVVQEMVKKVHGRVLIHSQPGKGTKFELRLPVSLALLRVMLVTVAGEPYALPLAQIGQAIRVPRSETQGVGGRSYFRHQGVQMPLVSARRVFGMTESSGHHRELKVIILGEGDTRCGLEVDAFQGDSEVVVQSLDPRLGKIRDISAAAILEEGSPVLILDVQDLVRSAERAVASLPAPGTAGDTAHFSRRAAKRILVVDDSITVRELLRKILTEHGYVVETAVDGMDGWTLARTGEFDLCITDRDMPRLDGLEMVRMFKRDARLCRLPILMVSHKDREQDRLSGLEAGADEYITKSGFQDKTLLEVVRRTLGKAKS